MAEPIPLNLPPRDPRAELRAKLDTAPLDHAEALLAAYEVLQGLHDKGMFDTLRGAIGSSEKTLGILVDAAKSPDAVRGMRNLVVLVRLLSAMDPEVLKPAEQEPLSLWRLFKKLNTKDSRRALTTLTAMLESVGKTLGDKVEK
jgi:uncharacterized protein YjgD (DUF1641 family)